MLVVGRPHFVASERRTLVIATAFLATAMAFIPDFAVIAVPIQDEFSLSSDDANALQFFPVMAGLLMVFVAAALAVRLGRRMTLALASAAFGLGAMIMVGAPGFGTLVVGLALVGIGSVITTVVGLSLINVTFAVGSSRGKAFGVVAALSPIIALVVPNVSASMSAQFGWRFVPLLWAGAAALLLILSVACVPGRQPRSDAGEWVTPVLAGVALAAFCYAATTLDAPGPPTVIALATAGLFGGMLVVALRRQSAPGLDLRVLGSPGGIRAALALMLIWSVSLTFYASVFLQFRFDYSVATATLVLTITEVAGIAGGLLFGFVAGRLGAQRAALVALGSAALLSLGLSAVATTADPWRIVMLASLVAIPSVGSTGPVTEHFLNHSPKDGSDGSSALADALSSVGFVVGGTIVGIVVFSGFASSFAGGLEQRGYSPERAQTIAAEIRGGVSSADLVARDGTLDPRLREVLLDDPDTISGAQESALGIMGLAFCVSFGAAAILLLPGSRGAVANARGR